VKARSNYGEVVFSLHSEYQTFLTLLHTHTHTHLSPRTFIFLPFSYTHVHKPSLTRIHTYNLQYVQAIQLLLRYAKNINLFHYFIFNLLHVNLFHNQNIQLLVKKCFFINFQIKQFLFIHIQ